MNRLARSLAVHAALVALAIFAVAPLLWMALASLRPAGSAIELGLTLAPGSTTLANYAEIFTRLNLATAFLNSLLVALLVTAISLVTNSMAGYAFAKLRFRGRDATSRLLAAALVVPSQVAMLPLFLLVEKLGMVNTLAGVVVPGLASVFGIFLIRQYALSLPDALLDAARVDGAGELRLYVSVVLPLCRPALVTLGVFTFLGTWNDFLWPLVVLSDARRQTLPVALANLLGEHVHDIELMMAGATLTVLPPVLAFVLLQRSYVRAILAGGMKE
jgi:multiple sugar transport system permease protein